MAVSFQFKINMAVSFQFRVNMAVSEVNMAVSFQFRVNMAVSVQFRISITVSVQFRVNVTISVQFTATSTKSLHPNVESLLPSQCKQTAACLIWTAVGVLATKTGFILSGMLSILGVFLKVSLFVFQQFLQLQAPVCHAWWWAQWQNVLQVRALQKSLIVTPYSVRYSTAERSNCCVCVCVRVLVFLCNLLFVI